jgi:3-oxoacyl-[acyl-carrier protein] reductase
VSADTGNPAARAAVVLAGSRGLGRGAAEALLASGHAVLVCGREQATLDDAVGSLRASGGEAIGMVADVSDGSAAERVVQHAIERFGRLDVLVANAGGPRPGSFSELEPADWESAYHLTLMSAAVSMRAAIAQMKQQRRGRLIVIGSSSVRTPIAGLTLSNVFRPALDGLIKSLAVELAELGITVNMVCPGRIDTDRVRALDELRARNHGRSYEAEREASEQQIPMRRYGRPEEIGAVIGFLASDSAGYVTGQSILVDGGLVPTLP